MALIPALARAILFFGCFAGACSTTDVDPSTDPGMTPVPTVTASSGPPLLPNTWVPRENPELLPATGVYTWKNVVVMGGGFVSGVVFGPSGTPYARTDVGGAYRWDDGPSGGTSGRWVPLLDWAGRADSNLMGVESLAPDPSDPNTIYAALGTYASAGNGQMLSSNDRGTTWAQHAFGAPMAGNSDGRSMGERLAVDPNLPQSLYFASRAIAAAPATPVGLWHSSDSAVTWQAVPSFPATGNANIGLSFVVFDPRSGSPGVASSTIYVGVATTTGPSLYRSTDAGSTWAPIPGEPASLMPHHAALDATGVLYAVYGDAPGPNGVTAGAVWKLNPSGDTWTNITPPAPGAVGYGGLALDVQHPGTVIVSTLDYWAPDLILRTVTGGVRSKTDDPPAWTVVSTGTRSVAGAQYLYWDKKAPINNGTGWAGSLAIDPTNGARALSVSGQGLWWSDNLDAVGTAPAWTFQDFGLEETVPLAVVSPPSGPPLLSGLGDIAGFRHDDLDAPPASGMFKNPIFGNTNSIDFAESNPAIVARVGTSSNGGGRGASSSDGGVSWEQFATEPAGSNGQGTIAVSADGATFLWVPRRATGATQASFLAFNYSTDQGATWQASVGIAAGARGSAVADRVNPLAFYALVGTALYASADGGQSFSATGANLAGATSLRCPFGQAGEVWAVTNTGLYRSGDAAQTFTKVGSTSAATDVSFGKAQSDGGYPAVYLVGSADTLSGILRSDDEGATWTRIDDNLHQFGFISHISGDPRSYGRVYLGTGGRGIIYGDVRAQ